MESDKIIRDFSLLKRIVSPENTASSDVDISALEKLISTELPEALEDNAPSNFPQLYFDFRQEFERFKEFILFDKLIGKNIVALGGGFSTGKSSFANSILGNKMLPSDINPSTSVPTYIVNGSDISVYGINTFGSRVEMELDDVKSISHGFGKISEDDNEATLGHILRSIFISSPEQRFSNIALLDTPGYSKAESADYSAKTDEKIARTQLNSANFILWFVQADAGTITNEDINFLNTINKDIPKLIIVNRADKVIADDLKSIVEKIKSVLDIKGIQYVDVLTYTNRKNRDCDRDKIIAQLDEWNGYVCENRFAYNFKVLFTKCKEYYDEQIEEEKRRLSRLNKALTLTEDAIVTECLTSLISEIKRRANDLTEHRDTLKKLRDEFFSEIKRVGDIVHIEMPEPSEIDLIRGKSVDPKSVLDEYIARNSIKKNSDYSIILENALAEIKPALYKVIETSKPADEITQIIMANVGKGR